MKIYWIKAQAPRRVLALVRHLGLDAECIEVDMQGRRTEDAVVPGAQPQRQGADPGGRRRHAVGVVGDHGLPVQQGRLGHVAGATAGRAGRGAALAVVERQPLVARGGTVLFRARDQAGTFHIGEPDRAELAAALPDLHKLAPVLDGHLASRDFVACGRLTIADFQLASMACEWRHAEMPFDDYPNIARWLDRLMEIPAWADPWPTTAQRRAQRRPWRWPECTTGPGRPGRHLPAGA